MYTARNFQTKKDLKTAVVAGEVVGYFQPGPFGGSVPSDGTIYVSGPHYPQPHKWYAECKVVAGCIVKVK